MAAVDDRNRVPDPAFHRTDVPGEVGLERKREEYEEECRRLHAGLDWVRARRLALLYCAPENHEPDHDHAHANDEPHRLALSLIRFPFS